MYHSGCHVDLAAGHDRIAHGLSSRTLPILNSRFAGILFLLTCACGRRDPGGAACPHDPGFNRSDLIHVRADVPPVVLRRDLDLPALSTESHGTAGTGKVQGLTEIEHQMAFRTLVNVEKARGQACVWFGEVNVDITPASVQIFVPREYPAGSCEYLAVLAHEREHVQVHRARLATVAEEITSALTSAKWLPARGNPLAAADRASAEAVLNAKIRKVVTPVYERYKGNLTIAQAELDRPDLYQWVSKRCGGWK